MLTSLFPRFADNIDGARCIGAKNAFFPGNDPPWTKNGENASVSFPYPTCFFIMG